MLRFIHCNKL